MKKTLIALAALISIVASTTSSHAYYKWGENGYYQPSDPITCTYTYNGYTCS